MLPNWIPYLMVVVVSPFVIMSAVKAWRGVFRPSPVTWSMWAAAPLIAGVAALSEGAGSAAVPIVAAGIGPVIVLGASLCGPHREHRWPVTRFDLWCAGLACIGIAGWLVTGSETVAVAFAVAADAAVAVPTYRKAWSHPESEAAVGYVAGLVTGLTALGALTVWVPANWLFPAWLVTLSVSLITIILVRRPSTSTGDEAAPVAS